MGKKKNPQHEVDVGAVVRKPGRHLTPDETAAFMSDLLNRGVKPHAERIAAITETGDIAVVVFEASGLAKEGAASLGWDGASPIFRLSNAKRKTMADHLSKVGDKVSANWFNDQSRDGRIYLVVHEGAFLLNVTDNGLEIEPGSLDSEGSWKS